MRTVGSFMMLSEDELLEIFVSGDADAPVVVVEVVLLLKVYQIARQLVVGIDRVSLDDGVADGRCKLKLCNS